MATLPGRVHQAIVTAILSAFRPDEFSELFRVTTDRRLEEIVGPANYRSTVSQALDWLESRDVEKRFMLEARQANPTSKALVEIADQVAFGEPVSDALEKAIAGQLPLFDPADFRASMVHVENRVCQLQVDGIDDGTAFLIGPDKVMTNYHVIRRALGKPSPLIVASFDFSAQRSSARQVQSAADWLIDKSPFADVDIKPVAGKEAGPNELDYAIIRLAERIGDDPPNPAASEPRGWIRLDLASPEPAAGDLMLIMQHPGGGPKRCAAGTYRGTNAARTRMQYTVNTESGSSGSPCFSLGWQFLGLHHGSEPGKSVAAYNEGIPAAMLTAALTASGALAELER